MAYRTQPERLRYAQFSSCVQGDKILSGPIFSFSVFRKEQGRIQNIENLQKWLTANRSLFSPKHPSWMFDMVLNTRLNTTHARKTSTSLRIL